MRLVGGGAGTTIICSPIDPVKFGARCKLENNLSWELLEVSVFNFEQTGNVIDLGCI